MQYAIEYRTRTAEVMVPDEAAAREILDAEYPNAYYGAWELVYAGMEVMLVWASRADSESDEWAKFVAKIRRGNMREQIGWSDQDGGPVISIQFEKKK